MKFVDLSGQKFNRLTVIEKAYVKNKRTYWLCECECGNKTIVMGTNLTRFHTKSCGCLQKEKHIGLIHGLSNHRLANIWCLIKKRCLNEKDKIYKYYGAKGITICNEWKNDFKVFYDWAINNGYEDNLSIDRIDVNGNYEPNNCRWVDKKTQTRNTTTNKYYTYKNETHCIGEWAEIYNIRRGTLWDRLNKGWSIERALTTPVKQYNLKNILRFDIY